MIPRSALTPGTAHRMILQFPSGKRLLAFAGCTRHIVARLIRGKREPMSLITILILAAIPFVLVPIVLIGDTRLFERDKKSEGPS